MVQPSAFPATASPAKNWGYLGDTSPEHWSELSPEFQLCQTGQQQAPIDIAAATASESEQLQISYHPTSLSITNTLRTLQVNYAPGSFLTFQGETFQLLQFHFHHPSEHRLLGKSFDLEIHLVHRSPAGKLAVIGVFAQVGKFNSTLKPIWDAMPAQPGKVEKNTLINAAQLLPPDRAEKGTALHHSFQHQFYKYRGSLTTPPCTENVLWFVMTQPIEVSAEQVRQFAALFPLNARPIQARGDRVIKQSL